MAQRAGRTPNLRTVQALRGESLTIDLGKTLLGTLTAWMKKDPNDTTYRSFDIIDNRYLFLSKEKAQDYYNSSTGKIVEYIEGKWFFDVIAIPVGGTAIDESVVFTGTVEFENQVTNSNGQELVDIQAYENPTKFIELLDTPETYGTVGQTAVVNSAGTGLEWVTHAEDKHFTFDQGMPSAVWSIPHMLGKYVSVVAIDSAGSVVVGQIDYIDLNNITITFNASFSGSAFIN
tara:strand:- start:495 stop:1190 length:696 start_codon:yes stop_codon:yes gene_type:complete